MSEDLIGIVQSAYAQIGTSETEIGDEIQDGYTRYIYSIIMMSDDGSEQNIEIFNGDSANKERHTVAKLRVADATDGKTQIGGDINSPIMIIRPDTTNTENSYQANKIYMKAQTSTVNVLISYYDKP